MGDRAMDNPAQSGERLREELSDVLELIRRAGGGVVFEDFPGAIDEMDGDSAGQSRAARGAAAPVLVEEANRLAETLDRLRRGDCGASEEVGDLVAAASPGGPRDGPVVHRRSLATSVVDQGPLGGSEAAD